MVCEESRRLAIAVETVDKMTPWLRIYLAKLLRRRLWRWWKNMVDMQQRNICENAAESRRNSWNSSWAFEWKITERSEYIESWFWEGSVVLLQGWLWGKLCPTEAWEHRFDDVGVKGFQRAARQDQVDGPNWNWFDLPFWRVCRLVAAAVWRTGRRPLKASTFGVDRRASRSSFKRDENVNFCLGETVRDLAFAVSASFLEI